MTFTHVVCFIIGVGAGVLVRRLQDERSDQLPPAHPYPFHHIRNRFAYNSFAGKGMGYGLNHGKEAESYRTITAPHGIGTRRDGTRITVGGNPKPTDRHQQSDRNERATGPDYD